MARKLMYPRILAVLALVMAAAWTPCSADTTVPTKGTAAASGDSVPVPAAAGAPVSSTVAVPAAGAVATQATATNSKKIPLAPPDVVEPAAEVVSALPVPVPETLPSAEGLGFGSSGFNGGQGGFGCCGGFGYNGGLGYNNGPLFFNSAPARRLGMRSMATGNGLAALLVAGAAAMFYVSSPSPSPTYITYSMAHNRMYPWSLALVALVLATSWMCSLQPCSADTMVPQPTTAAASADNVPVRPAASVPLGSPAPTPAATPATPAMATASKKIPLPVPVPETIPGAEGLGFGGGYGGQTVPGGGLGGFNGDQGFFGGCCGGFGYNGGPGYNNGPLFFNSAPATRLRLRMVATGNGFAPLLVAGAAAMFYA
nr:transcription initiation factor TFIID subunit 4 [Aegilops tauschii subsp. strangulata]